MLRHIILTHTRNMRNLTQYELDDRCEINRNYIGMLERGERNPTYLTLMKVAARCGVDISEFFKKAN